MGDTVGRIPKFSYEMAGRERTIKLTGNRLGDNAPRVIIELVEQEGLAEEGEVAPVVTAEEPTEEEEQVEAAPEAQEEAEEAAEPEDEEPAAEDPADEEGESEDEGPQDEEETEEKDG